MKIRNIQSNKNESDGGPDCRVRRTDLTSRDVFLRKAYQKSSHLKFCESTDMFPRKKKTKLEIDRVKKLLAKSLTSFMNLSFFILIISLPAVVITSVSSRSTTWPLARKQQDTKDSQMLKWFLMSCIYHRAKLLHLVKHLSAGWHLDPRIYLQNSGHILKIV